MGAIPESSTPRRFNLTMLNAAYDAFRRDMARMPAAASAGAAPDPGRVARGWAMFRRHWLAQQAAEQRALWTVMRGRGRPALFDELELRGFRVVPLLDGVDAALEHGDRRAFRQYARTLPAAVNDLLDYKEAEMLPLIHRVLTPFEWGTFDVEMRRELGMRGLASFLPWLLDGAPDATVRAVMRLLPPPFRMLYRARWLPRYQRAERWAAPAV
ncbi:hemerythrin domain-containing protein [Actinomadura verrucosospora]|uniref:Hemerythrin HHE cation binding domain-containing protein n=1 Tax=Actinomadura verrucosospora TaxID=46165 RepID=A0A7D3VR22_ACTVE|nr:hemerythrin domain-containing protein [Actinomadura verrucosospora]QKG20270.1 hemerythrin HHE cation binding domain-containing protein [Actinomadura verrucosospora]